MKHGSREGAELPRVSCAGIKYSVVAAAGVK